MTGLAIYLEGGGNAAGSKAKLRQGMSRFLREPCDLARARRLRWKIVACGGRDQAMRWFRNSVRHGGGWVSVLLVDAEGPLRTSPRQHLSARDGWDLRSVRGSTVQLMVQTMETWIVADPAALVAYFGQNFAHNSLPGPDADLEAMDRVQVAQLLKDSTKRTSKREYKKIRDGSALLARIDPETVQGRCPSCARLFDTLRALLVQETTE